VVVRVCGRGDVGNGGNGKDGNGGIGRLDVAVRRCSGFRIRVWEWRKREQLEEGTRWLGKVRVIMAFGFFGLPLGFHSPLGFSSS